MDEEYDVVVCGTGLKESVLSGLLSAQGKKVLHVDRNGYYGGEGASLNLTNLYAHFRQSQTPPEAYGSNRNWNADLIPKFIMASGTLVKILVASRVTKYLDWRVVEGTFVYQYQQAGYFSREKFIHKVPASGPEALASPLMGLLEKNRCKQLFQFCAQWEEDDTNTWKGFDCTKKPMSELYEWFGLGGSTQDFVGHALALETNDEYLTRNALATLRKIKLYMHSISRYGKSPFVYPMYGLGGLPEGFSRLCAINGGTFMLNKEVKEFLYENGKVCGVTDAEGNIAKCRQVICSPEYCSEKTRKRGKIIRVICLLNHSVAETNDSKSAQIIVPQNQVGRQNDIYITVVSSQHGVVPEPFVLAIVSTVIETADPYSEIRAALNLLRPILEEFVTVSDVFEPTDDGTVDNVFVSSSFDASSHFEETSQEILRMWKNIAGHELNLTATPEAEE